MGKEKALRELARGAAMVVILGKCRYFVIATLDYFSPAASSLLSVPRYTGVGLCKKLFARHTNCYIDSSITNELDRELGSPAGTRGVQQRIKENDGRLFSMFCPVGLWQRHAN